MLCSSNANIIKGILGSRTGDVREPHTAPEPRCHHCYTVHNILVNRFYAILSQVGTICLNTIIIIITGSSF
jgi:hypothetical protein